MDAFPLAKNSLRGDLSNHWALNPHQLADQSRYSQNRDHSGQVKTGRKQGSLCIDSAASPHHKTIRFQIPLHVPKRKFDPSFAPFLNFLRLGFLILRLQFLLHFLKGHAGDSATLLRRGTLPIMNTAATNLSIGDLINPLAALLLRPLLAEPISLGTPVTVLLLLVREMSLTQRPFFL